jgi:lysozyme
MFKLSDKGVKLLTNSEGLELESYKDSANVWTIGYGTTTLNGYPVEPAMRINEQVAWALFMGKINETLDFIEKVVRVTLNQNQVDALCSFTYNLGKTNLLNSSLLTAINAKMIINEDLFTRWNKAHVNDKLVELPGLTIRRKKEYALFTKT